MSDILNNYLSFIPNTSLPIGKKDTDYLFIFKENQALIIKDDTGIRLPTRKDLKDKLDIFEEFIFLGDLNNIHCYALEINEFLNINGFDFITLRQLTPYISEDLFLACGKAYQILHWNNNTKYCGKCGCKNEFAKNELAKICPNCSLVQYPKISPAIIVTVTKGNEILLAHNKNFPKGLHSNVAGFLEPCETLEDCVRREVFEETGIKIKNIKYFGNQPWPFPDSIMIGFFAEYESGEIKVDGNEIECAHWFTSDNLPILPEKYTIARKMIDTFLNNISH